MGNAKFQVIIKNIDETALGPILGGLPNNISPEIMRMHGRTTSKLAPKIEPSEAPKSTTIFESKLAPKIEPSEAPKSTTTFEGWIQQMPAKFRARDLMNYMEKVGANPNSISHFIRRATERKLIRKVPGTAGTITQYERL